MRMRGSQPKADKPPRGVDSARNHLHIIAIGCKGALRAIAPGHSLTTPKTLLEMRSHIQIISMYTLIY